MNEKKKKKGKNFEIHKFMEPPPCPRDRTLDKGVISVILQVTQRIKKKCG